MQDQGGEEGGGSEIEDGDEDEGKAVMRSE